MNKIVSIAATAAAMPTLAPALASALPEASSRDFDESTLNSAGAGPHSDSELLCLVDQFIEADRRYRELSAKVDRLEETFNSREKLPDVLRWRPSDLKFGLPPLYKCPGRPKPNYEAPIYVDPLRGKKWSRWTRVPIKGHPVKGMFYEKCTRYTPSRAARARADEIIAAYDEWTKPGVPPRGFKKATRERDKADKASTKLENRVLETRAVTLDGMLAKIRCAHAQMESYYSPAETEALDLEQISGCAPYMAISIFRDLHQIALAGRTIDKSRHALRSISPVKNDPVFEAIEIHRAAYASYKAGLTTGVSDRKSDALCKKEFTAMDRIAGTVPLTLDGLFAMLSYIDFAIEQQGSAQLVFGDDCGPAFASLAEAAKTLSKQV